MKYIAITIGPIVEALLGARKTGELWASSYIFSYIMKMIVTKINEEDIGEIILPIASTDEKLTNGAGLYPDRIYLTAPEGEETLKKITYQIEGIVKSFSEKVHNDNTKFKTDSLFNKSTRKIDCNNDAFDLDKTIGFFKTFFKIYTVMVEIKDGENIVEKLSTYCDTAELQNRIRPLNYETNPLQFFLKNINETFLLKEAFSTQKNHFDFLLEITTREFKNINGVKYQKIITYSKEKEEDEDYIISQLKNEFPNQFMARHKYFTLVHADGDYIGKIINKVGSDPKKIKEFSEKLFSYSKQATDMIIEKFDGVPIYMGGDDMLFLTPITNIKNENCSTIFNLIENLDILFEKEILDYAKQKLKLPVLPSMSYGVAINYYKTPLYEVRTDSYNLLAGVKQNIKGKNAANVKFQKHSGQEIKFTLSKNSGEHKLFTKFIKAGGDIDDNFINSFTHKIAINKLIITKLAGDKDRLEAFFKHNFNENYNSHIKFFEALRDYILEVNKLKREFKDKEFDLLYGALRFLHFINSKDKE